MFLGDEIIVENININLKTAKMHLHMVIGDYDLEHMKMTCYSIY